MADPKRAAWSRIDKRHLCWRKTVVEWLAAPSPLPTPESFMDTLDPIYISFPTYRLLDGAMRDELRVLLAQEARRWVEQDVPAGRTAKVHLALARVGESGGTHGATGARA